MTRRVIKSITEVDREKFKYLHPYSKGGQAGRTWTSRAPLWYRNSVVSRSWVPRTMESSMSSSFLSRIRQSTGISFIFAMRFRRLCMVGIKERGQVGVYLMNGLE